MKKRKREEGEERERYRDIERKRWRDKREQCGKMKSNWYDFSGLLAPSLLWSVRYTEESHL